LRDIAADGIGIALGVRSIASGNVEKGIAAMRVDRHIFAHAGLCVTYVFFFGLLVLDGQIVHAALALAAAAFYAILCHGASARTQ
jgi:hypothetical protein